MRKTAAADAAPWNRNGETKRHCAMTAKKPDELRSHRWFGESDMRGFGHHSRAAQMGYSREDYQGKPVIAIINTWSDINTCHTHFRQRAEEVKRGVLQAGGFPLEMPAIALAEVFQKPTTMLYRNLLAMETEELLRSYPVDGCVLMGGCDKTTPAMLMGALSMNLPAIFMPAGPMLAGHYRDQKLGSGSDVWKFWAEKRAGNLTDAQWRGIEEGIARSPGHCMTMGTASTMTSAAEAMGFTLPGAVSIPAADSRHGRMAAETGRRIVDMVWEDLKPRDIVTAGAIDNAITTILALGGSTNAVVHMVAVARRAGVPLTIDRFDALARRTPLIANLRPAGKYLMEDFFYAGGLRALLTEITDLLSLSERTANGRTLGENIAGAEVFNRDVILPRDRPLVAKDSLAVLRGNLAPNGAVIKPAAAEAHLLQPHGTRGRVRRLQRHGGAHRRSGASGHEGLGHRAAERGSARRARHAGMGAAADPEKAPRGRRARHAAHLRRADERHELRRMRAARRARIVRRRAARVRPRRRPDRTRRRGAQARTQGRRTTSSRARRAAWTKPAPRYVRGFGALYQQHIRQADEGCDFDFLEGTAPTPEPEIH